MTPVSRGDFPRDGFRDYLALRDIPEAYLDTYEAMARAFADAFEEVPLDELGSVHAQAWVDIQGERGATDRAQRNTAVVCDAFLAFVAAASQKPEPPAPTSSRASSLPPADETDASEHRRHRRVPFVREVHVENVGPRRASDLSVGGLYLEAMDPLEVGMVLTLKFNIGDGDATPLVARARVLYLHPGTGCGVGFVGLSAPEEERIRRFVVR
jgi:hypothetical protein